MWMAIGETLPFAIGLALSPFAIVTGIVLLLGKRGRTKSALFGLGWFAAITALTTIALFIVDTAEEVYEEATETGVNVLQLVFAVLFFVLALVTWRKRPGRADVSDADAAADEPAPGKSKKPSLLSRLDGLSMLGALGVGIVQGLVVIKNIPLALSAGAVFGEAGLAGTENAAAVVVFALVATLGVIVPLGVAMVGGERLTPALQAARDWVEANMSPITLTVLLVLGALFLGQGLDLLD